MANLVKLLGFYPQYLYQAQDGKPVQVWDGKTAVYGGVQPSKSADTPIDVVGLGTQWPWGFTAQQLAYLYWRPRWNYSVTIESDISAATSWASADGVPMHAAYAGLSPITLWGPNQPNYETELIPAGLPDGSYIYNYTPYSQYWDPTTNAHAGPVGNNVGGYIVDAVNTTGSAFPVTGTDDITKLPGYPAWGIGYGYTSGEFGSVDVTYTATSVNWGVGGGASLAMDFYHGYVQYKGTLGKDQPAQDTYWPTISLEVTSSSGFAANLTGGAMGGSATFARSLGSSRRVATTQWDSTLPPCSIQKLELAGIRDLQYYVYDYSPQPGPQPQSWQAGQGGGGFGGFVMYGIDTITIAKATTSTLINKITPGAWWEYIGPTTLGTIVTPDGYTFQGPVQGKPRYNWWNGEPWTSDTPPLGYTPG